MKKLFVTVEVKHLVQAQKEIERINQLQADGVLLSNEPHVSGTDLFLIAKRMKEMFPKTFIGIAPLDMHAVAAVEHATNFRYFLDMLFVRDSGIFEGHNVAGIPKELRGALAELRREKIQSFGSFSITDQNAPGVTSVALAIAEQFDVVVVQCEAVNIPTVESLRDLSRTIRMCRHPRPLAIRGDLTTEQREIYLPHVNMLITSGTAFSENKKLFMREKERMM